MSTFDPDAFMSQEIKAPMETKYTPVPEDDYQGMIDTIAFREINDSPVLDVAWKLVGERAEAIKGQMGMEMLTVRQSIFIDMETNGAIAIGPNKNVRLGRLREALNLNNPKKAFSFRMLEGGGPVLLKVTQRADKKDSSVIYNDVSRVTAL